jgi:hypothetical protein
MPLATLIALSLVAAEPVDASAAPPPRPAVAAAPAAAPKKPADDGDWDEIPTNAPRDDYGLVAWCYGALDEYLSLYDVVKPDLKAIDKLFGSPVQESEPYAEDIAGERQALKRFAAAMEAAERASPQAIAGHGVAAMDKGRSIWSAAKQLPRRKMADAWLFWGVPKRCETTAKSLKASATLLGQAMAIGAPAVDPAPAPPVAPAAPSAPHVEPPAPH